MIEALDQVFRPLEVTERRVTPEVGHGTATRLEPSHAKADRLATQYRYPGTCDVGATNGNGGAKQLSGNVTAKSVPASRSATIR